MSSALDRLVLAGVDDVHLPSGSVIRGRLPTVEDLAIRDLIPQDLLAIAARFTNLADTDPMRMSDEEKVEWQRFVRMFVANYIRAVRNDAGVFEPVAVSIDDTFTMDPRDIDELEYIVLGLKSAAQVSAIWQAVRGEITEEAALAVFKAEAVKTVPGWATFRGFAAGVDGQPGGAGVRPAAEPDARGNRAARRAGARRGARTAPADRAGQGGQGGQGAALGRTEVRG